MTDAVSITVAVLIVAFAIIAVEVRDLVRMAAAFSLMSVMVAFAFYLMGSPYVSVFQLAVNAGAVTVLFLALLHVIKKRRLE